MGGSSPLAAQLPSVACVTIASGIVLEEYRRRNTPMNWSDILSGTFFLDVAVLRVLLLEVAGSIAPVVVVRVLPATRGG